MIAHGTYNLASDTTVRFSNSVATYDQGHVISVEATDNEYHKQLVSFGERDIDWFYEGDVERWCRIDSESRRQTLGGTND